METRIEFIKGNFYQTRDRLKVECVFVLNDGRGLFVWPDAGQYWCAYPKGHVYPGANSDMDIIGPWRDPAQVRVGLYRHRTSGQVRVWDEIGMSGMYAADTWELVETWTLTEGTGDVPA